MDNINLRCLVDVQSGVKTRLAAGGLGAEKYRDTTVSGRQLRAHCTDWIARGGAIASAIVGGRRRWMRFDLVGGDRLSSARDP